jgi:hypothetical protein
MNIESRADYPAAPSAVFALLTNKDFLGQVCERTHAQEHRVTVDGNTVHMSRTLPAPDQARPFTGPTLTVVEEISWGEAEAAGSRTATISMTVPGQPVTFRGSYRLSGDDASTVLTLSGEIKVNVPLLGKKMEQASEPAVLQGFRAQQELAPSWL